MRWPENSSDLLAKMANTLEMALCYSPLAKSLAKVLDKAESLEYRAAVFKLILAVAALTLTPPGSWQ